jgi:hypothetical protein
MNTDLFKWLTEHFNRPGQLATLLVLIFLAMFMGLLPSPMLSAIAQVTREHAGIEKVLKQICVNTAKDQAAVALCSVD